VGQRGVTPGPTSTPSSQPTLSPVPVGVLRVVYQAQPVGDTRPTASDMNAIAAIVQGRLAAAAVTDAVVRVDGVDRLVVELPATGDIDALRAYIGQTGRIDFVPLGTTPKEIGDVIDPVKLPALFSSDQIESASVTDGQQGRTVTLVLREPGAGLFADYTSTHVGEYFAIVLDSKVVSAPVINSEIPGGQVEITAGDVGGFSLDEARRLAGLMQYGSRPFPLLEVSNEIVPAGPSPSTP
jgi:preprotein translocase subunit SecD